MAPETTKVVPLTCHGHSRPVTHISFSAVTEDNQYYLLSACKDNNPMLRDGITGDWIGTFIGHKGAVWQARLSADGKLAATGSADFTAKIWDTHTGEALQTLQHNHIVRSVAFPSNNTTTRPPSILATGGAEKKLRVFDLAHPSLNSSSTTNGGLPNGRSMGGVSLSGYSNGFSGASSDPSYEIGPSTHQGTIKSIIYAPQPAHNILITAADDKKIRWFDTRGDASRSGPIASYELEGLPGSCELSAKAPPSAADVMTSIGNGDMNASEGQLLTVAAGKSVYFFECPASSTGVPRVTQPLKTFRLPREAASAAANVTARRFVTGGGGDTWVRVYDLDGGNEEGKELEEIEIGKGHHGPVWTACFSPDGKLYATGSEDGTVKLWKFTEGPYGLWG